MARRKTGGGSILTVIAVAVLGALAAVPKEVWFVGIAIVVVLGAVYLVRQQSRSASDTRSQDPALPRATNFADERGPVPMPGSDSRASAEGFRIPSAPASYGLAQWVPAGQSVQVAGRTLPQGMFYVGTSLPTLHGDNDPCLIDPSKPVARQGDFTRRQMDYWPSYSEVTPAARAAYLDWLAGGRRHPEADIGYVFLFFYGLERRAIIDAEKNPEARDEWPVIGRELRELLAVYGERSGSFKRYAGELLNWVELGDHPRKLYEKPIPEFPRTYELPLYLRLALGYVAADGVPVPGHLALAWARLAPEVYLRTPATRCSEEFERVFLEKYANAFGPGMVLPRNRTKLKLVYRPASAGFRGYNEPCMSFNEVHDVSVLTAPIKKLAAVVEEATVALEPFSRYIGRNPTERGALEGLLQLPATLWPAPARGAVEQLKVRMGEGMVALSCQELLDTLGAKSAFTREKFASLARALESMNIAMEPDVLSGARPPKPTDKVVLFGHPPGDEPRRDSPAYRAALLTLELSSAVATADGSFGAAEITYLHQQIQSWTHLTPAHQRRLLAHLRLLATAPVTLAALKKKLEPVELGAREAIAAFMATVAQSDGTVSAAEVKMLEKVYKALGVEPRKVFSDVHAAAAGTAPVAAVPTESTGFRLDPAKVAALQRDSEHVASLLAGIFKEDEGPVSAVVAEVDAEPEAEAVRDRPRLLGLDETHETFARMLLSRPKWSREELVDIAADLELMLDGALEHVNEACLDASGMPLTEGEDPVEVNAEVLRTIEP